MQMLHVEQLRGITVSIHWKIPGAQSGNTPKCFRPKIRHRQLQPLKNSNDRINNFTLLQHIVVFPRKIRDCIVQCKPILLQYMLR